MGFATDRQSWSSTSTQTASTDTTSIEAPSTESTQAESDPPGEFDDERASYGEGNSRRRRRRRGRGGPEGEPRSPEPAGEPVEVNGLLELRDEGYGFLRTTGYLAGPRDVYVSASQVRRFALRKGDYLHGFSRPQASNEKYPALLRVDHINDMTPDDARERARFEDLTPLFPDEKVRLELADNPLETTGRIVDLISPIGKGQLGLIVSPPKAGKTTILKQLVYSIERNNPEVHLIVLLVDERPEEVTDMRRHVTRGDVVSSTFDRPAEEHTIVADLAIERAKRLVELGTDVVVVLDGITRLARAYNLAAPASGRILSGGGDSTSTIFKTTCRHRRVQARRPTPWSGHGTRRSDRGSRPPLRSAGRRSPPLARRARTAAPPPGAMTRVEVEVGVVTRPVPNRASRSASA